MDEQAALERFEVIETEHMDKTQIRELMDRILDSGRTFAIQSLPPHHVVVLWEPETTNIVMPDASPPTEIVEPKMHISEILQVMISRMVEARISSGRGYAFDHLAWQGDPKKREAARGWLIGEPVPASAYPRFIEMAIDLASMGRPLDISMCERLRELAAEAERGS